MKAISQHIEDGITSLSCLYEALQLALQLELATIPPYLCAQWSIVRDPSRTEAVLHRIVGQEMAHFAAVGNLLSTIGGKPSLANDEVVPRYPTSILPGGIKQPAPIDLLPLTRDQVRVFMNIERPEFEHESASNSPNTIGEFYDAIIRSLYEIKPDLIQGAHVLPAFGWKTVSTIADAVDTLTRIKVEGEGLQSSPNEPPDDGTVVAHYYSFKEIYLQRKLIKRGGKWSFTGMRIELPQVIDFAQEGTDDHSPSTFSEIFSDLLEEFELCWTEGKSFNTSTMFKLQLEGRKLIANRIRPNFRWRTI